jgi:hypothetical protein
LTSKGKRILAGIAVPLMIGVVMGPDTVGVTGMLDTEVAETGAEQPEPAGTEMDEQTGMEADILPELDFTEDTTLSGDMPEWTGTETGITLLDCGMPEEHQEFLYALCEKYNVDFTFTMALIRLESNFDPEAVSGTGDYGYMQINEVNHEWLEETLGITDWLDPYQNMEAGVYVLWKLFKKYGDADLVLMAYNMGEHGAARLWDREIYETDYTRKVWEYQEEFNEQLGI